MSKTIGILGGMGPAATIDLFQKIVMNTQAKIDQEHLRIIIYNNPKIPPRDSQYNNLSNPLLPELIKSATKLEQAGADFIIMPCHTAHICYNKIKLAINIPIYSLIENTVQSIVEEKSYKNQKILLLATETTINSQIYQNEIMKNQVKIIVPTSDEQIIVDNAIKNVKAGKIKSNIYIQDLNTFLNSYKKNGVSILLGGCTEIPILFPYLMVDMKKIDPTLLLAKMSIEKAT